MFQFGTDEDEQQEGLHAGLLGTKPNSMPDFGLAATLSRMPNSGDVSLAGNPAPDSRDKGSDDALDTSKAEAAPAEDPATGEWGKLLAQLYEAGKFRSGYLSKIFGSVDYANLGAEGANTSIMVGLGDIENFEQVGDHFMSMQGSLIDWRRVDWSKYGADQKLPPETVMRNFFRAAMTN